MIIFQGFFFKLRLLHRSCVPLTPVFRRHFAFVLFMLLRLGETFFVDLWPVFNPQRCNDAARRKPKYSMKNPFHHHFVARTPTWTALVANPALLGEDPGAKPTVLLLTDQSHSPCCKRKNPLSTSKEHNSSRSEAAVTCWSSFKQEVSIFAY